MDSPDDGQEQDAKPSKRIVLGDGPTVTPVHQRNLARAWFLAAVMAVAPDEYLKLMNVENLRLAVNAYSEKSFDQEESQSADLADLVVAVQAWQVRYCLEELWIRDAALATLQCAVHPLVEEPGKGMTVEDIDPFRVDLYTSTLAKYQFDEWTELPVFIEDLYLDPQHMPNGGSADGGLSGTFHPRVESLESITYRLLEALRPRVRQALKSKVADHRELEGALTPVVLGGPDHFRWLVRYQVLGESRSNIARATGKDKSQISKAIKLSAELTGITLRIHKGGRPKKGAS